jgi:hypothetical protein
MSMGVKFTIDDVRRATYLARERRETTLRLALEMSTDAKREKRIGRRRCVPCFYSEPHIVGSAFTAWTCACCSNSDMYPNTGTPRLCYACSERYSLCVGCGADLSLAPRNKLAIDPRPRRKKAT